MVRSFGGGCFCWSLGGCGTRASRPLGVSGVMTMKMISSTSNTSISGVTFMSEVGPPPGPPIVIAITRVLSDSLDHESETRATQALLSGRRRCCRSRCRRRRGSARFALLGKQTQLVHSGRADIVHHFDHIAVPGSLVGANEDTLVDAVRQLVLDLVGELVGRNLF